MSESTWQVDDIGRPVEAREPLLGRKERQVMAESENERERPCLHCLMVELIDDFFAEYPPAPGGSDKVDTEEGRNHRGGRGEDKSRSGRRCWRCYRIWLGGGLAVSFAMAKAKSGIGNAVRRAVKHGIETVSSHAAKQALA